MYLFNHKQYDIYNELIYKLYKCRDIKEFQSLLQSDLLRLVPSDSSILMFYEKDGITARSSIINNLDTSLFNQYQNHYQNFDNYKNIVHRLEAPPVVNRVSDFIDYNEWGKNEHRADFLLPQNIHHITCLEIIEENKILTSISLHRGQKHHNFSDREKNILYILAPVIKNIFLALTNFNDNELTSKLTAREKEILPLLISQLTNEELASYLGISHNTIKTHIRNILHKLNCSSRAEIMLLLYRERVIINEGKQPAKD